MVGTFLRPSLTKMTRSSASGSSSISTSTKWTPRSVRNFLARRQSTHQVVQYIVISSISIGWHRHDGDSKRDPSGAVSEKATSLALVRTCRRRRRAGFRGDLQAHLGAFERGLGTLPIDGRIVRGREAFLRANAR